MRNLTVALMSTAMLTGVFAFAAMPELSMAQVAAPKKPLSAFAKIGEAMFYDPDLSGDGEMSCASCHSPDDHYGPPNALPVQFGGPHLDRPGLRTVPTLTYKDRTPAFSVGPEDATSEADEASPMSVAQTGRNQADAAAKQHLGAAAQPKKKVGNTSANAVARGGLFWDGRAATLQDQALGPLFAHFEMDNHDVKSLAAHIRAKYGEKFAQLFGAGVLNNDEMLLDEASFAFARYQIESPAFHSYSSKYDAYLAGTAKLSPAEARGLKLFEDPKKGNCAACHLDKPDANGNPPLFTDFEYEALAVPRNPAIPANKDPKFHDLGICGPLRTDAASRQPDNCGLFKTPTLRNVATRKVFFHNGVYTNLTDVVKFYANRESDPGLIYPKNEDGSVAIYNDLPKQYWGNIDRIDAPFSRKRGDPPLLTDVEIADLVAFLNTLTDGWTPAK